MCRWHHPYGRKWRGTKEPLDEGESGDRKSWLKTQHSKHKDHGIQSHHFMANRWGDKTVRDFIFLGSKITADGDCSHEIKRYLLLGRKSMTNLDSILNSRDVTLPTKVHLVKAMVFPVVMYGCERKLDYKEGWVKELMLLNCGIGEKALDLSWAERSNQTILKEISPEYSLEGLMLKLNSNTLATWCEELTLWKQPWCWEWLKAGGEGDDRGWDGWTASLTQRTWVWASSWSWWWTGKPGILQSMESQRVGHNWETELNWTDIVPGTVNTLHPPSHLILN